MAPSNVVHVIYVPHGMSTEQVWEHIQRGVDVPVDPRETTDPETPTKYGQWLNVMEIDGVYKGEV